MWIVIQLWMRDLYKQSTQVSLLDFMALITGASSSSQGKEEKDKIIKAMRLSLRVPLPAVTNVQDRGPLVFLAWFFQQRSRGCKRTQHIEPREPLLTPSNELIERAEFIC